MAGPFKDDDDKDGRLAKQLERSVKGEKRDDDDEKPDEDVKEFAVGGEEDDSDDAPEETERATRLEKKQERKRLRDEAEELRRENQRLRDEREDRVARGVERTEQLTRAAVERLTGGAQQQSDPLEREMKIVTDAEDALLGEYNALNAAGKMTAESETRLKTRARQIEEAKHDVMTRRSLARQGIQRVDPEQAHRESVARQLREEHQDVYANEKAVQYAQGEYQRLQALGHPDSKKTHDMAMDAAREQFKLGGRSRSRDDLEVDRRRFSGQSKQAGAGGGKTAKSVQVKKGSHEWNMALAFSSHIKNLSDEQKVQRWVNRVGAKS